MIGKRQLIVNVDNVTPYTVTHNSTNVPYRGQPGSSVVKGVCFIGEKVKSHVRRYLKTIEKSINPAFHAWVVIESVVVKVAKFKVVPF